MSMDRTCESKIMKIGREIILQEVNNLVINPLTIKQNGCAACHILFKLVDKMQMNESDATDLLSQIRLHDPNLNGAFMEMVEDIHMKQRMMATPFFLKVRSAKDNYIDANFKNFLEEKSTKLVNCGNNLVLRKLLISAITLEITQNIGMDYHAALEELYYYMRKNDEQTNSAIIELVIPKDLEQILLYACQYFEDIFFSVIESEFYFF
jgi:hypothetical protein